MDESLRMLGQRIVSAARLAATLHFASEFSNRQREATGGAGLSLFTDETLPAASDCAMRSAAALERRAE